jgi:hypothetical protein
MPSAADVVISLSLFIVCILLAVSMFLMSSSGKSDNLEKVKTQIRTMYYINFFLVIILGSMMYYYISTNAEFFRPYMMFMIHANLLLSLTAVSISSIQQLN